MGTNPNNKIKYYNTIQNKIWQRRINNIAEGDILVLTSPPDKDDGIHFLYFS